MTALKRKKYQVFTPEKIVKKMLDGIGYFGETIINKRIVDLSCGNGAFLKEALKRYLRECAKKGLSAEMSLKLANDHIFGCEIENSCYLECCGSLREIAYKAFGNKFLLPLDNILNIDGLKMNDSSFDYVVGNPPYISYKEMSLEQRDFLRGAFSSCAELKFDYSYAFIEKSFNLLKKTGLACIITPINMYRIKSGRLIRAFLRDKIYRIIDVTEDNVFPNVLTNPVISFLCHRPNKGVVSYSKNNHVSKISINSFLQIDCEDKRQSTENNRFGDYFSVRNGVATLLNKAFIVSEPGSIEKELLKEASSPKDLRYKVKKMIIFPYKNNKGCIEKYDEKDFVDSFPNAYNHLLNYKDDLLKRDTDPNIKWYEYGRCQALQCTLSDKIIIPSVFTEKINPVVLDRDCVVYAGFYILSKDPINHPLSEALDILLDPKLFKYIQLVGVKMNGKTYRYSVRDLENYRY